MNRAALVISSLMALVSPAVARDVRLAQANWEDLKQRTLLQTERAAVPFVYALRKVSDLHAADRNGSAPFAQAKRDFDFRMEFLRDRVAVLRATPAPSAQIAIGDVNAALEEVRKAFARALDLAR